MIKKRYITEEAKTNCQKVADVFAELYENEDLIVPNAGKYGFVAACPQGRTESDYP